MIILSRNYLISGWILFLITWTEHEKSFNLNYADDRVQFSDYMKILREEIRKDTIIKLED